MDQLAAWEQNNEQFLAKALAWLRLRLQRLAPPEQVILPATPVVEVASKRRFWERGPEPTTFPHPALPPPGLSVSDEQIAAAREEMDTAAAATPPPAMAILRRAFGLGRFEEDLLLLCAALELDTRIAGLCARAQDNPQRPYPTFALALALFDDPSWDVLSPEGSLRRWRLIEISQPGAQPLTTSPLRADERIVNFLKGLNYLDDRLATLFMPLDSGDPQSDLAPSQEDVADEIERRLREGATSGRLPVIELLGQDGASKQLVARRVAQALGLQLYRLPVESLAAHGAELELLARLLDRESALWPLALYVDAQELDAGASEGRTPLTNRFLARSNAVCLLAWRASEGRWGRETVAFDISRPTRAEQQAAWAETLGDDEASAGLLASQFDLNLAAIGQITRRTLEARGAEEETALRDQLWDACLESTRPRLDALAQRIEPKATWNDIVLPSAELELLRQIAGQVRHRHTVYETWGFAAARGRGLSINALFAGESGTGKTMAAEVIANELRLNLYRIDLSAVVSKYIGETEKNLRRLFDAAEDGGALLFFDEADALFGKRSEVKDSHDRYANIEVNYLLQRLETYQGLAIMATNMRSALDPAFMRRIRFVVEFRPHGLAEREAIWARIFPPQTRTEGLDLPRLARLALNGGSINNIAINAAFLAAQAGTAVTMPLVLAAARSEFHKLKRPINEGDFAL